MNKSKIFCIGMFKTGTTTMGEVFELLGYKTFHGPFWDIGNDPLKFDIDEFIRRSHLLIPILDSHEAFQDYPFMFVYKWLHDRYPDAKFILTERSPEKVAVSDINMWKKNGIPKNKIPNKEVFIIRYKTHINNVIEYFAGNPNFIRVKVGNIDDLQLLQGMITGNQQPLSEWPKKNIGKYGINIYLSKIYWCLYWLGIRIRNKIRTLFN